MPGCQGCVFWAIILQKSEFKLPDLAEKRKKLEKMVSFNISSSSCSSVAPNAEFRAIHIKLQITTLTQTVKGNEKRFELLSEGLRKSP